MFATLAFGLRLFVLGVLVGVLVAPRAGRETRQLIQDRFIAVMDGLMEILAVPGEPIDLPAPTETPAAGAPDERPSG